MSAQADTSAVFPQEALPLIDQAGLVVDQPFTGTGPRLNVGLLFQIDCHEGLRRPGCGLCNGLGIALVAFVKHHLGTDLEW